MKYVVYLSGGAGSWAAAKRVIAEHGTDDVTILFADTKSEDCDLYRFLDDAERDLGIPIIRVADGRTIWEVFHDRRFIGNSRIDPCSKVLKRDILDKWRNENCTPDNSIHYIGFDWAEGARADGLRKRVAPWNYQFPMFDRPLLTKIGMLNWMRSEGLKPPRLYDMGFEHNNCGGFCVKAGHAQFRHLLKVLPDRYRFHEEQEEKMRILLGDVTVLRDRSGGDTRPLTMREFREGIEAGQTPSLFEEEWGGCGCATDYENDG